MNLKKTGAGILGAGTLIMGGVDAAVLKETPLERVEIIGEERVEAKQIENRIETTFPWKDQNGLKVVVDLGEPTIGERVKDKRKKEVVTEVVDFGDGGFKVDIILNEKPDTNRFCYVIEGAENYDFFYQPALTKEEIANGAFRPPEIEGSYAVYHKTLANNEYKTGKVMHIPRPQVWELGNEENTKEWAELSYADGQLCVAVRQGFLDDATYPVRVDPTFGYTSIGASLEDIANRDGGIDTRAGSASTLSEAGDVTAISAALRLDSSTDTTTSSKVFINQQDNPSSGNHTQSLAIERTNVSLTATATWIDYTGAASLGSGSYILSVLGRGSTVGFGRTIYLSYDSVAATWYREAQTYTSPESPWVTSAQAGDRRHSIYATYTASGSGGVAPIQDLIIFE